MRKYSRGFNLLELMTTIAIAGILVGLGVPSFVEFIRNSRMTSTANELLADVTLARTEAIKRRAPVMVCPSPDPLAAAPVCAGNTTLGGWISFVDFDPADPTLATNGNGSFDGGGETILRRHAAPPADVAGTASTNYVSFGSNGFQRLIAGGVPNPYVVRLCDDRGNTQSGGGDNSAARALTVARTGRAEVTRSIAQIAALGGC